MYSLFKAEPSSYLKFPNCMIVTLCFLAICHLGTHLKISACNHGNGAPTGVRMTTVVCAGGCGEMCAADGQVSDGSAKRCPRSPFGIFVSLLRFEATSKQCRTPLIILSIVRLESLSLSLFDCIFQIGAFSVHTCASVATACHCRSRWTRIKSGTATGHFPFLCILFFGCIA